MAEQDTYGSHLGANPSNPTTREIPVTIPNFGSGSGAEQDRWAAHLSRSSARNPEAEGASFRMPTGSGAEQDRYAAHFSPSAPRNPEAVGAKVPMWTSSGAEQDRYASHFSPSEANNPTTDRIGIPVRPPGGGSGAEQDIYGGRFGPRSYDITAVGILKSTLLPSMGLHSGLAVAAYTASRVANRVDGKDWLWPSGQVINAWWSAVGHPIVYGGVSLGTAFSSLAYPDKVLLGGVTAWGAHLFYRMVSRSVASETDDARYLEEKKDPGFWNKALFKMFLPEAVFQTIISLPFTLPFRDPYASVLSSLSRPMELAHDLAVFVFSAGFALEVLADYQLNDQKKKTGNATLNRSGVWSIVRHPNYLGDALVHLSFTLFLWGSGKLHPIVLLGPLANYAFLRYVGGDAQNEASQAERYAKTSPVKAQEFAEYKNTKNSFWPRVQELTNPWTLAIFGVAAGGLALERAARTAALRY
ncbi:unnamed protein product [Discula destructiva]